MIKGKEYWRNVLDRLCDKYQESDPFYRVGVCKEGKIHLLFLGDPLFVWDKTNLIDGDSNVMELPDLDIDDMVEYLYNIDEDKPVDTVDNLTMNMFDMLWSLP